MPTPQPDAMTDSVLVTSDRALWGESLVALLSAAGVRAARFVPTARLTLHLARPVTALVAVAVADPDAVQRAAGQAGAPVVGVGVGTNGAPARGAGVWFALPATADAPLLLDVLHRLGRGEGGRDAPAVLGRGPGPEARASASDTTLTRREQEVVALLTEGVGSQDIAERLGISPNTVRSHVQNLLGKLDAGSRLEAVAAAERLLRETVNGSAPVPPPADAAVWVSHPERLLCLALAAGLGRTGRTASACAAPAAELLAQRPGGPELLVVAGPDAPGQVAAVRAGHGELPLLVVGDGDPGELLAAVEAGADGYVTSDAPLSAVFDAADRVRGGEAVVPPEMLSVLLRSLIRRRREEDQAIERFSRLSRREREILALLVAGRDQDEMADALVVSPHTARTHVQNVLRKLRVHSRLEAAALARRHGFLDRFTNGEEASS